MMSGHAAGNLVGDRTKILIPYNINFYCYHIISFTQAISNLPV